MRWETWYFSSWYNIYSFTSWYVPAHGRELTELCSLFIKESRMTVPSKHLNFSLSYAREIWYRYSSQQRSAPPVDSLAQTIATGMNRVCITWLVRSVSTISFCPFCIKFLLLALSVRWEWKRLLLFHSSKCRAIEICFLDFSVLGVKRISRDMGAWEYSK